MATDTNAARDVLAERQRQIAQEGWSEDRDDEYRFGELAAAAACYCHPEPALDDRGVPFSWPWLAKWWKPTDRRRDLVKAGALILAEIERLDRITLHYPNRETEAAIRSSQVGEGVRVESVDTLFADLNDDEEDHDDSEAKQ